MRLWNRLFFRCELLEPIEDYRTNVSFLFFLTRHRHAVILLTKVTGLNTLTCIFFTTNHADWTSSEALLVDTLFAVRSLFQQWPKSGMGKTEHTGDDAPHAVFVPFDCR